MREPNQAVPDGSADFYTFYSYDILNHLISVSMTRPSGTQTRSFTYNVGNAVGAYLLQKTEPETGTTHYTYSGGLLQTKVDANGSKTQYTYDSYGRVKMIQHYPYSSPFFGTSEDTCQQVTFSYDSDPTGYSQNAMGRQTSVQYQGAGCGLITPTTQTPVNPNTFVEMYSYSPAGLIVGNKLLVSQTAYYPPTSPTVTADLEATYTYNNEGTLMGMTYPSSAASGITGDTYTYSFDSMNRPKGLTDHTNGLTAVNNTTYGPAGEMKGISYGAINETRTYNSLLQLKTISAYNVGLGQTVFGRLYTYSGTNNNGKIQSETDTISGEVVTYQYDWLNRLIQATGTGWGNRLSTTALGI